jgi:hypothetical protein
MTKSAMATPGFSDLHVSTVKMEGSYNNNHGNKMALALLANHPSIASENQERCC